MILFALLTQTLTWIIALYYFIQILSPVKHFWLSFIGILGNLQVDFSGYELQNNYCLACRHWCKQAATTVVCGRRGIDSRTEKKTEQMPGMIWLSHSASEDANLCEDDRQGNWGDQTDTHRWTLGSNSSWQPVGSGKTLERFRTQSWLRNTDINSSHIRLFAQNNEKNSVVYSLQLPVSLCPTDEEEGKLSHKGRRHD